ncbi:MAG: sulfite exporter TauE/SafE family protein [Planctomycetes bacterium]|nr:sulfite exporter TauE/SafE family protein [Planctomycetota bacterium]
MNALWLSTLGAGFAGSLHCAAMCGSLVWVSASRRPARLALYQVGRLISYVSLGALAGALGNAVDAGAWSLGIQRGALWTTIALLVLFVIGKGALQVGLRFDPVRRLLAPLEHAVAPLRDELARMSPNARAFGFGALSALLPCGFLWVFVVVAAGTGAPLVAAGVMAAFFLGTLPALVLAGVCAGSLKSRLDRRVPRIAVAVLVIVSLWGVLRRAEALEATQRSQPTISTSVDPAKPPCCHDH